MPKQSRISERSYRWFMFWLLALGYVLVYFHRLCPAVLAVDMMRDLDAGGALTGFLGAAYFYPYALMQLPAGLLSDSWGPRNTISLFFLVAVAGTVLLGLAPTAGIAILGRGLVGLGVAMLFVPTLKILAEWFHAREFALMTGILMAMGGIGSLSAAAPLVWLSSHLGWRLSFIAVGVFTLLLAVLVRIVVRDRPADLGMLSPVDAQCDAEPSAGLAASLKMVLTTPAFWPIACWFFFTCAIFFSFGGLWGGPYLQQVYSLDSASSGRILSMLSIGMIVGSPVVSWLSTSVLHGRKPMLVLASVATLGLTALLAFRTAAIPAWGLYAICFGLGVFSSAIVVVGFTANKELFPVGMAGTATGVVNLFPFAGGAVFQPVLGAVLERYGTTSDGAFTPAGYHAAMLTLFGCAVIAMIAAIVAKETMNA